MRAFWRVLKGKWTLEGQGMSKEARTDQNLFQLSAPLMLSALIGMVVILADTVILSSYSENTAAAVSIANQILLVAFDLSTFFSAGAVVMISRRLGADEPKKARQFAEVAVAGNAIIGFFLGLILYFGAPWWIAAIKCPAVIVDDAIVYLRVGAFTIVFNGVMMAGTAMLRAYGKSRVLLVLALLAYTIYLPLSYGLVFGAGPFPEMGVKGSALATLVVRVTAVVALLGVIVSQLKFRLMFWRYSFSMLKEHTKRMLRLSWPLALDNLAYGFYQIILVSFIAGMSVAMVLSRSFTLVLSAVLTVLLMSLSQANEVMVGYRYGAKNAGKVTQCVVKSSLVAVLVTTLSAVFLAIFAEPLFGLFTKDPEIVSLGTKLLWLTVFVQPFSAVNTILYYSLKTIGDVVVPVAGTQIMMWLLSVPVAYLLAVSWGWGVVGLWWVLLMEESFKAAFLVLRWRRCARSFFGLTRASAPGESKSEESA